MMCGLLEGVFGRLFDTNDFISYWNGRQISDCRCINSVVENWEVLLRTNVFRLVYMYFFIDGIGSFLSCYTEFFS